MEIPSFLLNQKENNYDIQNYENKNEIKFPESYKWFSEKYGFHNFKKDILFYSLQKLPVSNDNYCSLGSFFGWGKGEFSLASVNNEYKQIPSGLFIIAEGAAGDFITLGIDKAKKGKIYYWHHESPENKDTYLIADTFEEFISGLKEETITDKKDSGIESEWLDDDF